MSQLAYVKEPEYLKWYKTYKVKVIKYVVAYSKNIEENCLAKLT